ncbi:OLC1v1015812C2 [Oldenlandia corymbosa var. corymbosa]|uniref:OLC1v1015812C2 n=1 Tax=Oldenlandia corymbosa var. corymbosa TaxID=529605 RepID=A0AAV1E6B6_OLDCO|nr:OLC1v1015812C2 [Oldenlandia corymbosa var. corymbosa]
MVCSFSLQLRDEDIWIKNGRSRKSHFLDGEARCLKRRDLIDALANALPPNTVQFGCNTVSVKMDPESMSPALQLDDDKAIRAKVLIGCDGSNSKVAEFVGLKPASSFPLAAVRGLSYYQNGHPFPPLFVRMRGDQGNASLVGRIPINDKLVYWFVAIHLSLQGQKFPDDPELIKQATLKMITGFPADVGEMIEKSDLETLSFTHLRYRHPWEILVGKFHKGPVTVLGDAMHVMGPFLGQGGSAALEDAVVLARNLAQKLNQSDGGRLIMNHKKIEEAFDEYVKERRMRIMRLSTQTYLFGVILGSTSSFVKFIAIVIVIFVFRDRRAHTKYDCGKL